MLETSVVDESAFGEGNMSSRGGQIDPKISRSRTLGCETNGLGSLVRAKLTRAEHLTHGGWE